MKKALLFFFFFGLINYANAIIIQQITVSPAENGAINIHTKVADGYLFYYNSYNYEITDNVITLNICFNPQFAQAAFTVENDFVIPDINSVSTTYILVVNVYKRMYINGVWLCDSNIDMDTETLQFSTPMNEDVSLSATTFQEKDAGLSVFPNPTNGMFIINTKSESDDIRIFDNIGREMSDFEIKSNNSIDISDLDDGVYFVVVNTHSGRKTKKIILKK